MNKQRTNVEYEDAPSGNVYFYNYKEPLMKFKGGYGFEGALIYDGETDKIQCHYCGEWFDNLSHHIHREHNMTASDYKEAVGLLKNTALLNEASREKLIESNLGKRMANLRPGKKHTKETRMKISQTLKENGKRRENQNRRGTCPEQLIERLLTKYNELKRTPTRREIGESLAGSLRITYGSLKDACRVAGIPYREPGENTNGTRGMKQKWTTEIVLTFFKDYYNLHGEFPKTTKMPSGMHNQVTKMGGMRAVNKRALKELGKFHHLPEVVRYSKEELIQLLRDFERINYRRPSYSDCKRGLLPHLSRYSYNFGSWKEALTLAFGEPITQGAKMKLP